MNNGKTNNNARSRASWEEAAKLALKVELVRKRVSHDRLSELLSGIGVNISKSAIDSKLSRGTFSAAFLLQCLTVIGCTELLLDRK